MNFRPASADGLVACALISLMVFAGATESAKAQGVAGAIPANASAKTYGSGWECGHGYRKTQATCVAVQLPENAHLDFSGNDWECNKPYSKRMQACTSDNQND